MLLFRETGKEHEEPHPRYAGIVTVAGFDKAPLPCSTGRQYKAFIAKPRALPALIHAL